MKFAEVAENVKRLLNEPPSQDEFIYELLLAYGTPKASVKRLKLGQLNLAKEPDEVLLKKKVWFKNVAQASRLPNVPQASSLPDGVESPQDASGTEPSDDEQAGRSLYGIIDEMKSAKATKTNNRGESVCNPEIGFGQSGSTTSGNHIPRTGSHSLDVLGQVEGFRKQRIPS